MKELASVTRIRSEREGVLLGDVLEHLPSLDVGHALVDDLVDALSHLDGVRGLEDVTAHVDAVSTLAVLESSSMRASPSGKATASQAAIRGFESRCPLHERQGPAHARRAFFVPV